MQQSKFYDPFILVARNDVTGLFEYETQDEKELLDTLETMRNLMYDEDVDVRQYVKKLVPTYQIQVKK